jgi:4-hydroxybenzoate polyprenyltransferase
LLLMVVGSTALTAHVFVLNDWAGYARDAGDPRRAGDRTILRDEIAHLALALLAVAAVALAATGLSALVFGAAIAALSLVYSVAPRLGKSTPGAASLNHLTGGVLHFLMGYTLVRAVDAQGVALGLFFGLVFAAGHLNQEVRDHDADRAEGIRTSAVAFGCRAAFGASLVLFACAYGLVVGLAAAGVLPRVLLATAAIGVVQAVWSRDALRRGLDAEAALWIQRRYRLLFALVGVLMVVSR